MHLKRSKKPKTWPLAKKGTKYLVRPSHSLKKAIPLLIVLKDIIKIAKNKKEVKKILNFGKIKVNGKTVREEKYPLILFDNLSLDNKNFKLVLKNKKFDIVEIKEEDANKKISKIVGKKILKRGKIQINLADGRNYLIGKEKVKVGDSVVIDLKQNKIMEILPFKEKCRILFIAGKHIGEEGIIEEIDEKSKIITLKVGEEKLNSRLRSLMVIK